MGTVSSDFGELLATGAVTVHIPELARFPTEGNILILLVPTETPLQTIEETLSGMLDKVDLNGRSPASVLDLLCNEIASLQVLRSPIETAYDNYQC